MTANGKARITAVADDGMHIYNTNFLQEKVINYTGQKYRSGYREETAEVTPTGAQISYYSTGGRAYIVDGDVSASTIEEARNKVAEKYGNDYTVKVYNIDGKSFIHYYNEWSGSWNYYLYDFFGTQYPTNNLYALEDGYLINLNISYSPMYDESSAVWKVESESIAENDAAVAKDITYKNADTGAAGEDLEISLTQTLFNNDDKWEYVSTIYDANTVEIPSEANAYENDGKVILNRHVSVYTPVSGLGIYSEDGTLLATISANHVNTPESFVSSMKVRGIWRIDGKHYLETSKSISNTTGPYNDICALYLLGEGTSGARMVLEYEAPAEPDNTIYDLSGRRLSEKPKSGYYIQGGKKYYVE
jgi:hypothetical protein